MKINLEYGITWASLILGLSAAIIFLHKWGEEMEKWEKRKKDGGEDFNESEPDKVVVWRAFGIVTVASYAFLYLMCKTFGWIPS